MKKTVTVLSILLFCLGLAVPAAAECRWNTAAGICADWDSYAYSIQIELYKGSTEVEPNRMASSVCAADRDTKDFTQTIIDHGPGTYTYVLKRKDGSFLDSSEPLQIGDDLYTDLVLGRISPSWKLSNGDWYLMDPFGNKLKGWQNVNGKWYYMSETTGICYLNRETPDGYFVDETGAWDGKPSVRQ